MAFLGAAAPYLISAVASAGVAAATSALSPGAPKPQTALKTPQRDDARAQIQADDEIRKRRGAAADILYGAEGAGAPAITGKLVLGA